MTDKELIRILRVHHGEFSRSFYGEAANRLEALIAENEHLREATKMVPQWHPVSEPPEEYRDEYWELICFLVCAENCGQPFRAFYDGKHWGDGWNRLDVTHWMPLPEPPSTEGGGANE